MQQDGSGLGILGQVIDQIVMVDVHAVAEGQEVGKPHTPGKRPVQYRAGNGAGLPHKGHPAGNRTHVGVGGVQVPGRHHQPDGVGAEYPDTGFTGGIPHRVHQRLSRLTVGTGHTAGHHNSRAHTPLAQLAHHFRHGVGRRTDNGEIRREVQLRYLLDTGHPVHVLVFTLVDHHQPAGKTATQKVTQNHTTQVICPFGCTDHDDRLGVKQAFQIAGTQRDSPRVIQRASG